MRRTVVITGVGLCTPVACDWAQLEESLLNEQVHGFKTLDTSYSRGIPAAVVTDPALDEPPTGLVTDRTVRMALLAARRALVDASVPDDPRWLATCWVGVGNGCGPTESNHAGYRQMMETGRLPALTLIRCLPSSTSAAVAMALGAKAGAQNYSCACASSTVAIGEAFRALRHGYIDRAIVGGSESPTEESLLKTWESLRVLAPAGAHPALACKPFDVDRKGIVLGEGAVFFVMESLASAQERGARIHAQVLGFGTSADAHHWTEPHSEGQQAAMRRALQDAELKPEDIVAINAHGTATTVGDRVELDSLQSLFAPLSTPVSSTKSLHGHMLGASGAMELACCLVSLKTQTVAPTRNLHQPEACGSLHLVSGQALQLLAPGPILSNSFAFGGSNACLVVGPISKIKDHDHPTRHR